MNIDDLTYGELKKIASLFQSPAHNHGAIDQRLIGKKVIVRTYSAGVHYGEILEKEGNEVILKNSRRLYYWKTKNGGISLSEIANHGVHADSKVCENVDLLWVNPIEIIPCTESAIKEIEAKNVHKA